MESEAKDEGEDVEQGIRKVKESKVKVNDKNTDYLRPRIEPDEKTDADIKELFQNPQTRPEYNKHRRRKSKVLNQIISIFLPIEMHAPKQERVPTEMNDIFIRLSGKIRPIIAFMIVPSLGLLVSNLVSSFEFQEFWSYIVMFIPCAVSTFIYFSYLGPILGTILRGFLSGDIPSKFYNVVKERNLVWKKHSKEYFVRRGDENAIFEIEYIKNIIYVAIPILVILTFIYSIDLSDSEYLKAPIGFVETYFKPFLGNDFVFRAIILSVFYDIFLIIFMLEFLVPKEFRYYFAQACIRLMSRERDEIKRIHYLTLGLNSYNRYLRRNINLQFNDTKVYSGIFGGNSQRTIQKIASSFESDELKTLETLCETLQNKDELFVKQKIGQKVKDWATLLAE